MTGLAEACAGLARWLPAAAALIAQPDADGTAGGGKPGSRPPWNPAAADAKTGADEGVRRLEASLRLAVTGGPGPRRGGSDGNTAAAITAIGNLGTAVTDAAAAQAARIVDRWTAAIEQLPAIDEAERPKKVAGACPYCGCPMLRAWVRDRRVTCLKADCADGDGSHPEGRMDYGRLDGSPVIEWADGLVT
jgi:hypothetical protein